MLSDTERHTGKGERVPHLAKGLRRSIKADMASLLNNVRFLAAGDPVFAAKLADLGLPKEILGLADDGEVSEKGRHLASLRSKGESGDKGGALKPLRHKVRETAESVMAQIAFAREIDPSLDEELRSRGIDMEALITKIGTIDSP